VEEREQFIQQFLDATSGDRSPLTVLLTVRADLYFRLLQNRELLDQLQDGKADLGPMKPDEDTRRRADLRSFDEPTRIIAHRLAELEHRLLVTTRATETGTADEDGIETVEVAHEALLRSWSRLRRWIDEE
jgi:hypothetical protein